MYPEIEEDMEKIKELLPDDTEEYIIKELENILIQVYSKGYEQGILDTLPEDKDFGEQ